MAATENKQFPLRAGLVAALGFVSTAHALDWKIDPSVGAAATYTDNANQSATNPEDALILSVTPSVSITSKGSRRVQAAFTYGVSGIARFGEDESTKVNHRLSALGKAEVVEDFFFVEGKANVSQELISLTGSPATADINDSNRATVGTYSISPYIQQRFGTFANGQVRLTQSGTLFENDVASNSSVTAFSAGLTSGTRFDDLSWGLNYSIRKADNRNNADSTFERASVSLGYALTRKLRVFASAGQDWNEYVGSTGATSQFDGSFYNLGFGWAPNRRTSLEMSAGERYFGKTFSASGNYRTRQSRWTLRYTEDVSDITQQYLEQASRVFWICNGVLVETTTLTNPDPAICQGPISAGQLASFYQSLGVSLNDLIAAGLVNIGIANGVYILKSFTAGVSWDVGRLGFGLNAQDTKRLYQAFSDAQDHVRGLTGTVSYRLTPKTTASGSLALTRTQLDSALTTGTAREDDLLTLTLGLSHAFAEKLNGALTFRRAERDSNDPLGDYTENRLTATVNMRF